MRTEIRQAKAGDLVQIAEIEHQCFSLPWSQEQLGAQLDPARYIFLVAEQAGTVAGYIGLMYVLDEGYISNVAIAPAYRRRGLGDLLVRAMEREAIEKKLAFMTLEVRVSNTAARSLYEKHGFTQVGLRKNYYEKPREDAILMTKFLSIDGLSGNAGECYKEML